MPRKVRDATKRAVAQAVIGGETYEHVAKRMKVSKSSIDRWIKQYQAGELGPVSDGAATDKPKTPEHLFNDRVRKAIVLLRQANEEVERMKQTGTLKEADTAHLYAGLALRMLQGDNGK